MSRLGFWLALLFFSSSIFEDGSRASAFSFPNSDRFCEAVFDQLPENALANYADRSEQIHAWIQTRLTSTLSKVKARMARYHALEIEDLQSIAFVFIVDYLYENQMSWEDALSNRHKFNLSTIVYNKMIDYFRSVSSAVNNRSRTFQRFIKVVRELESKHRQAFLREPTILELHAAYRDETSSDIPLDVFIGKIEKMRQTSPTTVLTDLIHDPDSALGPIEDAVSLNSQGLSSVPSGHAQTLIGFLRQDPVFRRFSLLRDVSEELIIHGKTEEDVAEFIGISLNRTKRLKAIALNHLLKVSGLETEAEFDQLYSNFLAWEEVELFSGRDRQILEDYFIEGFSLEEVGGRNNLTESGVLLRIQELRRRAFDRNSILKSVANISRRYFNHGILSTEWLKQLSQLSYMHTQILYDFLILEKPLGQIALNYALTLNQVELSLGFIRKKLVKGRATYVDLVSDFLKPTVIEKIYDDLAEIGYSQLMEREAFRIIVSELSVKEAATLRKRISKRGTTNNDSRSRLSTEENEFLTRVSRKFFEFHVGQGLKHQRESADTVTQVYWMFEEQVRALSSKQRKIVTMIQSGLSLSDTAGKLGISSEERLRSMIEEILIRESGFRVISQELILSQKVAILLYGLKLMQTDKNLIFQWEDDLKNRDPSLEEGVFISPSWRALHFKKDRISMVGDWNAELGRLGRDEPKVAKLVSLISNQRNRLVREDRNLRSRYFLNVTADEWLGSAETVFGNTTETPKKKPAQKSAPIFNGHSGGLNAQGQEFVREPLVLMRRTIDPKLKQGNKSGEFKRFFDADQSQSSTYSARSFFSEGNTSSQWILGLAQLSPSELSLVFEAVVLKRTLGKIAAKLDLTVSHVQLLLEYVKLKMHYPELSREALVAKLRDHSSGSLLLVIVKDQLLDNLRKGKQSSFLGRLTGIGEKLVEDITQNRVELEDLENVFPGAFLSLFESFALSPLSRAGAFPSKIEQVRQLPEEATQLLDGSQREVFLVVKEGLNFTEVVNVMGYPTTSRLESKLDSILNTTMSAAKVHQETIVSQRFAIFVEFLRLARPKDISDIERFFLFDTEGPRLSSDNAFILSPTSKRFELGNSFKDTYRAWKKAQEKLFEKYPWVALFSPYLDKVAQRKKILIFVLKMWVDSGLLVLDNFEFSEKTNERELVEAVIVDGLTIVEAADQLGWEKGRATKLMHRWLDRQTSQYSELGRDANKVLVKVLQSRDSERFRRIRKQYSELPNETFWKTIEETLERRLQEWPLFESEIVYLVLNDARRDLTIFREYFLERKSLSLVMRNLKIDPGRWFETIRYVMKRIVNHHQDFSQALIEPLSEAIEKWHWSTNRQFQIEQKQKEAQKKEKVEERQATLVSDPLYQKHILLLENLSRFTLRKRGEILSTALRAIFKRKEITLEWIQKHVAPSEYRVIEMVLSKEIGVSKASQLLNISAGSAAGSYSRGVKKLFKSHSVFQTEVETVIESQRGQ